MPSGFQKEILAVLASFPSYEQTADGDLSKWATPRDIRSKLGRANTPTNRVALSKALRRLHELGLVARASGEVAAVGQAFRYVLITDAKNAGAGNAGPTSTIAGRTRPAARVLKPRHS